MNKLIKQVLFCAVIPGMTYLSGCGGGDDGPVVITKGTANIVFSTTLPAGSAEQIGVVQLKFELPAGVTVSADASGAIPSGSDGVLKLSGEALKFAAQPNAVVPVLMGKYTPATPTSLMGKYTPATPISKATVNFGILVTPLNSKGMNPGEFATLVCDLVPGVTIDLTAFQSTFAEIASSTGVLLYQNPGGVTGPAAASYRVTLQYPTQFVPTGSTSGSDSF